MSETAGSGQETEVHIAPPTLMYMGPFPLTSAMFGLWLVSFLILLFAVAVRLKLKMIPGRLQILAEMVVLFFLEKVEDALGDKKRARRLLPFIVTIFLILLIANQFIFIPIVGSIILGEKHLFTIPAAHYSFTIALAVMGLVGAHIIAFFSAPHRHLSHFIKIHLFFKARSTHEFMMAFIEFFLGFLEIISEIAKVISLATRLFGNIFAGEVILIIVASLMFATQFIVPVPFIVLGILAGLVQAFVFATLLLLNMSATLNSAQPHNHETEPEGAGAH